MFVRIVLIIMLSGKTLENIHITATIRFVGNVGKP